MMNLIPVLLLPALIGILIFEKKDKAHMDIALITLSFAAITSILLSSL